MDILVLGGTAWLGREIAGDALARGHNVTCLARGDAGAIASGARLIRADRARDDAYGAVRDTHWHAVIDVARQPGHVRHAAAALEYAADRYLFVSSCSVYSSQRELDQTEDAALLPPLESDVMESMASYGEAKVACEQAVLEHVGAERTLIARAGLIGGPGDGSGRSSYWPWRFAHPSTPSGAVLVPDDPNAPTSVIDARDLAAWLVTSAERGTVGVFNVAGDRMRLADHLDIARAVTGHSGPLVAAPPSWLESEGVQSWMGPTSMPVWIDDPDWRGMNARNTDRARQAGLVLRPLEDTMRDVLAWERARPEPGPSGAGLTDDDERRLLAVFSSGSGS